MFCCKKASSSLILVSEIVDCKVEVVVAAQVVLVHRLSVAATLHELKYNESTLLGPNK